jgi:cell division septation protein DedD
MFDFWVTTLHVVLVSGLIVLSLLVLKRSRDEEESDHLDEKPMPPKPQDRENER